MHCEFDNITALQALVVRMDLQCLMDNLDLTLGNTLTEHASVYVNCEAPTTFRPDP